MSGVKVSTTMSRGGLHRAKAAARLAEREAVFSTLEKFGLIKRSRGGGPYVQKPENFL